MADRIETLQQTIYTDFDMLQKEETLLQSHKNQFITVFKRDVKTFWLCSYAYHKFKRLRSLKIGHCSTTTSVSDS